MGRVFECIDDKLADWIADQHLFFVATAPLAGDGLVNCSPKGMDSFRVLGPKEVAYLDLTGSGIETIVFPGKWAHRRHVLCLPGCASYRPPPWHRQRYYPDHTDWETLASLFPAYSAGTRAIIRIAVSRVSRSCGFAVPRYEYLEDRDTLIRWAESKGDEALVEYRDQKNRESLDGLPGMPL
ncbi:MAG: pyridoxamine 5'-phosphate oxidase family protein [Armatimonas sp.]